MWRLLEICKWLWQMPQNILGLLISPLGRYDERTGVYVWSFDSGVSLGNYVFVNGECTMNTIKHERGHQKQSLYLGPLYLILIGLPSLLGNLLHRVWKFDYYKQPWERWADYLGGAVR